MVEITTNIKLEILSCFTDFTKNTFTLSEISRKTGISHTTLIPHTKELQDILRFERRGRNKEFYLDKKSSLTRNYLVMAEAYRTIKHLNQNIMLKNISDEIKGINMPIILFGSHAKGYQTKDSDIDIAVFSKEDEKTKDVFKKISEIYGKDINLKFAASYSDTKSHLIKEIMESHIILSGFDHFVSGCLDGERFIYDK
ncbi:MAG: nucleotidyltransferase family protein [Nanobdellota archaeon]